MASSVYRGCQSSLLAKSLRPGCSPATCQLQVPGGFEKPGPADWRLLPRGSRGPRRIRQGWANSRSSFAGPAGLWCSQAQGSHIISPNIIVARHLSSSVYFVHKPSFGSNRFNRHLLNICAVSDHVQGARTARMNNMWLGLTAVLFSSFIIPNEQLSRSQLISVNLVKSNGAWALTVFPFYKWGSWVWKTRSLPQDYTINKWKFCQHNPESWFVIQCSMLPPFVFFNTLPLGIWLKEVSDSICATTFLAYNSPLWMPWIKEAILLSLNSKR